MRPKMMSYRGFLLRVWSSGDRPEIRASLTDIQTGETRVFADVVGLCGWLRTLAPEAEARIESTSQPRGHTDEN